jgi:hypothetical protein
VLVPAAEPPFECTSLAMASPINTEVLVVVAARVAEMRASGERQSVR